MRKSKQIEQNLADLLTHNLYNWASGHVDIGKIYLFWIQRKVQLSLWNHLWDWLEHEQS